MNTQNDSSTHLLRRSIGWALWMSGTTLLLFVLTVVLWKFDSIASKVAELRVRQDEAGNLRLSSASDGPFIITHLAVYGEIEGSKQTAAMNPPIAIVDSWGEQVTRERISKLQWCDYRGNLIQAPATKAKIRVLYFRPSVATFAVER